MALPAFQHSSNIGSTHIKHSARWRPTRMKAALVVIDEMVAVFKAFKFGSLLAARHVRVPASGVVSIG
jgi:hypothetical protein